MKHSREGAGAPLSDISLKRIGIGIAAGVVAVVLVALIFSAMISAGTIAPQRLTLCAAASVFAGGLAASVLSGGRRKILLSAALTALGLTLALAAVGALALTGGFSAKKFFLMLIILLVSCIIGSVGSSFIK